MREHGVRAVLAICQESSCGHSGSMNVDAFPDDFPVPDLSLRLRCSAWKADGRATAGKGSEAPIARE
jgi:hypothetical protein